MQNRKHPDQDQRRGPRNRGFVLLVAAMLLATITAVVAGMLVLNGQVQLSTADAIQDSAARTAAEECVERANRIMRIHYLGNSGGEFDYDSLLDPSLNTNATETGSTINDDGFIPGMTRVRLPAGATSRDANYGYMQTAGGGGCAVRFEDNLGDDSAPGYDFSSTNNVTDEGPVPGSLAPRNDRRSRDRDGTIVTKAIGIFPGIPTASSEGAIQTAFTNAKARVNVTKFMAASPAPSLAADEVDIGGNVRLCGTGGIRARSAVFGGSACVCGDILVSERSPAAPSSVPAWCDAPTALCQYNGTANALTTANYSNINPGMVPNLPANWAQACMQKGETIVAPPVMQNTPGGPGAPGRFLVGNQDDNNTIKLYLRSDGWVFLWDNRPLSPGSPTPAHNPALVPSSQYASAADCNAAKGPDEDCVQTNNQRRLCWPSASPAPVLTDNAIWLGDPGRQCGASAPNATQQAANFCQQMAPDAGPPPVPFDTCRPIPITWARVPRTCSSWDGEGRDWNDIPREDWVPFNADNATLGSAWWTGSNITTTVLPPASSQTSCWIPLAHLDGTPNAPMPRSYAWKQDGTAIADPNKQTVEPTTMFGGDEYLLLNPTARLPFVEGPGYDYSVAPGSPPPAEPYSLAATSPFGGAPMWNNQARPVTPSASIGFQTSGCPPDLGNPCFIIKDGFMNRNTGQRDFGAGSVFSNANIWFKDVAHAEGFGVSTSASVRWHTNSTAAGEGVMSRFLDDDAMLWNHPGDVSQCKPDGSNAGVTLRSTGIDLGANAGTGSGVGTNSNWILSAGGRCDFKGELTFLGGVSCGSVETDGPICFAQGLRSGGTDPDNPCGGPTSVCVEDDPIGVIGSLYANGNVEVAGSAGLNIYPRIGAGGTAPGDRNNAGMHRAAGYLFAQGDVRLDGEGYILGQVSAGTPASPKTIRIRGDYTIVQEGRTGIYSSPVPALTFQNY